MRSRSRARRTFPAIVEASAQTGTRHLNHIFTINAGVHATINNLGIAEGFDENPLYGGVACSIMVP